MHGETSNLSCIWAICGEYDSHGSSKFRQGPVADLEEFMSSCCSKNEFYFFYSVFGDLQKCLSNLPLPNFVPVYVGRLREVYHVYSITHSLESVLGKLHNSNVRTRNIYYAF